MRKNFIVYPKTEIPAGDQNIEIVDAPLKVKLKAFITGFREDYQELPSIEHLKSIFDISDQDAHMALTLFG